MDTNWGERMGHHGAADARPLVWAQPSARERAHELRAGEELVGTLRWERGSLAVAEVAGGRWTFKRVGLWRPRVTVRDLGADTDRAVFGAGWTGNGTLELPGGQCVAWVAANLWHTHWDWRTTDRDPLVRFGSRQGLVRIEGQVEIEPPAATMPELPLLVALGWYLLVQLAQDTADTAASVGGIAAATGS